MVGSGLFSATSIVSTMVRFNQRLSRFLKKPGTYMLIIIGLAVDFAIQWPFMVICAIENRFRNRM